MMSLNIGQQKIHIPAPPKAAPPVPQKTNANTQPIVVSRNNKFNQETQNAVGMLLNKLNQEIKFEKSENAPPQKAGNDSKTAPVRTPKEIAKMRADQHFLALQFRKLECHLIYLTNYQGPPSEGPTSEQLAQARNAVTEKQAEIAAIETELGPDRKETFLRKISVYTTPPCFPLKDSDRAKIKAMYAQARYHPPLFGPRFAPPSFELIAPNYKAFETEALISSEKTAQVI
jgi:hypothetical protein